MKTKAMSLFFMLTCALGITGVSASATVSNDNVLRNETAQIRKAVGTDNFSNAVEASEEIISTRITGSSKTPLTQSFTVSFASEIACYKTQQNNFLVSVTDPAFNANEAEKIEIPEEISSQEGYVPEARYTATIHLITNVKTSTSNVVIPSTVRYGSKFILDITSVNANAVDPTSAKNIKSITIPSTCSVIGENAFTGLPADCVINCEDESDQIGWHEGWTDSTNINYGYDMTEVSDKLINAYQFGAKSYLSSGKSLILGYYKEDNYLPLTVGYDVKTANGTTEERFFESSPLTDKTDYDAVGLGYTSIVKNFDIPVGEGEEIDAESVKFYNVFEAISYDNNVTYEPDLTKEYFCVPRIAFQANNVISDFINYKFSSISSFAGHVNVVLKADLVEGIYQQIMSSKYNANLSSIEAGTTYVRYRVTSLNAMEYSFTYETSDGALLTETFTVLTPVDQILLANKTGNYISVMIPTTKIQGDFDPSRIKSISLIGMYISLDLFTTQGKIITRSAIDTRFGVLEVFNSDLISSNYFNSDLFLILFMIIYLVAFAACAVGLYFILKERYKNDEFRRMNTKKYIKSALLAVIALATVILSITFIILRFSVLNSTVVVFNPVDAFLIGFTVAGCIFIGVYARKLYIAIKAERERRKAIRLRLNEDVDDDGTH